MSHKKKRSIIIGTLCGVLLLMVVGYAAFSSVLNINGTSSISSNWDIKITSITSKTLSGNATNAKDPEGVGTLEASFETNLESPGDSMEYTITISNNGNINAKLDKITLSDPDNEYVSFETSGLTEGDALNAGSTADLKVTVTFKDVEITKMDKSTSNLKVTLDYSQAESSSSDTPAPEGTIDMKGVYVPVVEAGSGLDGLYIDEYESEAATFSSDSTKNIKYIYKGAKPNNYITFNNEAWRILSVEKDGTLKITRHLTIYNSAWDAKGARDSSTSTYCTDASKSGCNAWAATSNLVGTPTDFTLHYPNGNPNIDTTVRSGTVVQDASLNTQLNTTYYNGLTEEAKQYIVEHDFNVGTPGSMNDTEDISMDIYQEALYKWNGKVGLMSVTEIMRTTSNTTCSSLKVGMNSNSTGYCDTNNWMWKTTPNWTISPVAYNTSTTSRVWVAGDRYGYSRISHDSAYQSTGIYVTPVVYLKSDITLSGSGTFSDPYTIN